MKCLLIPRVRVTYSFSELIFSLFVSEKKHIIRDEIEGLFTKYFDGRPCHLTASGRGALYDILCSAEQRKVMIPAYTCMVVAEAAYFAQKEIIYVNSQRDDFNSNSFEGMDSDTIVVATHQYGLPCDIESIAKECKRTGALLIEDCAASLGTVVNEKKVGTFGDYAIVSFNSTKLLNVPSKGGLIVARDNYLMDRVLKEECKLQSDTHFRVKHMVRGFVYCLTKSPLLYKVFHYLTIERKGKLQRSEHSEMSKEMDDSYRYVFTEWQASILVRQVRMLDDIIARRKYIYSRYNNEIQNPLLCKPKYNFNAVCCRYSVLTAWRDAFYNACVNRGVDMDFSHSYLACPIDFETEHKMANEILNIPFYYNMSENEVNKVVRVVNSISINQ